MALEHPRLDENLRYMSRCVTEDVASQQNMQHAILHTNISKLCAKLHKNITIMLNVSYLLIICRMMQETADLPSLLELLLQYTKLHCCQCVLTVLLG